MRAKFAASVFLALALGNALADESGYQVTRHLTLGAATKWDYAAIDGVRKHLFVTRGDHVDVVAIPDGDLLTVIKDTPGVHGVAFAQDLKLGFTSNGAGNSVTVFSLDSMQRVADIPLAGRNPDAILYEPSLRRLYVFNGKSANIEAIDAVTLKPLAVIEAGGRPEFAVSDSRGRIYFNIEDRGEIGVIDTATNKLVATWPLPGCSEPTGLALDAKNSRLFSTCQNRIAVVTDATTGRHVGQFAIGEHPDAAIYDADTRTVLTSCGGGAGSLSLALQDDADHYTARPDLVTERGAKTMAMDPDTKAVYLPTVVGKEFVVLVAEPRH